MGLEIFKGDAGLIRVKTKLAHSEVDINSVSLFCFHAYIRL